MHFPIQSSLTFLFLLFFAWGWSEAAISRQTFPSRGDGKCKALGDLILSVNESAAVPGECLQATCVSEMEIIYKTCPAVEPPPKCRFGDFTQKTDPYPKCCEREIVCK